MSLISEALRKAQLEALQQDREQRRFYMNHGGRPGHPSRGISRTSLAIIVLASLCVLSAGALLYLTLDRSNAATQAAALAPVAAPATITSAATPAKVARVDQPAAVSPEKAKRITPRSGRSAAAVPTPSKPRPRARTENQIAATAPETRTPRATARRLDRDGFREGETYGSPVLGPFGTEVVLSGITALRGQHVAIINGNTVRAGTAVGPFVVEEIEARRVRLKYVDITFYVVQ